MSYAKVFDNFEWVDQEDGETTPLSAANLNLINTALNLIDNRVIEILNGPFAAHVSSLDALGIIRTNLLAAHTAGGIITVSDDTCFSKDVEVEGDLSLAGSLAFQNVGTNTISSPTALTVTTPVSLTLNATSGIELSTGSGKATYNGSEIALKSDLTNSSITPTVTNAVGTLKFGACYHVGNIYFLGFSVTNGSAVAVGSDAVSATVGGLPTAATLMPSTAIYAGSTCYVCSINGTTFKARVIGSAHVADYTAYGTLIFLAS